jgi:hypothetical protein
MDYLRDKHYPNNYIDFPANLRPTEAALMGLPKTDCEQIVEHSIENINASPLLDFSFFTSKNESLIQHCKVAGRAWQQVHVVAACIP